MRAAVYVRISRDLTGEGAGVARQEQDCRAKALSLGWDVEQVFNDNDISAYSGKIRPGYRAMLQAIEDGKIDAVIVWHTDRLYRRITELEQYIAVCEKRNVPTQTVQSGPLDLATPSGRLVARQLGAVAVYESEQKGRRQKAANQQRAEQGRHFGTRRPFGYEADGVTIREAEAQAICDAFDLVLNGGTLREVARRWNSAGLLTPQKGQEWSGTIVSRTLRTARLAGIKTYLGEVVRGNDGSPVKTEWPPIVDPDTWHAAQAVLSDPGRALKFGNAYVSQLLLSGVALCAECGAKIQSGGKRKGRSRLRCSAMGGHVYREAGPIEDYVEAVVLSRLAEPDALELVRPKSPEVDVTALRQQANQIHAQSDAMAEAVADGSITVSQLKSFNERAQARLAAIEASMPTNTQSGAMAKLITARDLGIAWESLSLDARRGVVDALMTVRLVAPKALRITGYVFENGQRKVDPTTVIIEWK